jgi:shikimate kinase
LASAGTVAQSVVLVGMMGAGKTSVAGVLAARLGCRALDTDHIVEEEAGMSVPALFAARGERAFRDAESSAIESLVLLPSPTVVSVGGGAVLRERNRKALRRLGLVVWLRARPATLVARVGSADGRPVLGRENSELEKTMEKLVAERRPFYEKVADIVVDVDTLSPEQVADVVAAKLTGAARLS